MLVVHPREEKKFLKGLYSGFNYDYTLIEYKISKAKLNKAISDEDKIVFVVGDGTYEGMSSFNWLKGNIVRVVGKNQVDSLRGHKPMMEFFEKGEKILIGAWMNSSTFARLYGLHGIFFGNLITSSDVASDFGINVKEETVQDINIGFVNRLGKLINRAISKEIKFQEIPDKMRESIKVDAETYGYCAYPIVEMNYRNVFYR